MSTPVDSVEFERLLSDLHSAQKQSGLPNADQLSADELVVSLCVELGQVAARASTASARCIELDQLLTAALARCDQTMEYGVRLAAAATEALDRLEAVQDQRDTARTALRMVLARCRDPNAPAGESYERVAEEFWRETGHMAPGKDAPAALGGASFEERSAAFRAWEDRKWAEAWAAAKAVVP